MIWLLLPFLDPQPDVIKNLGSDRYAVRQAAERELGFPAALFYSNHRDPEVAARCSRVAEGNAGWLTFWRAGVFTFLVFCPNTDAGLESLAMPGWLEKWLRDYESRGYGAYHGCIEPLADEVNAVRYRVRMGHDPYTDGD